MQPKNTAKTLMVAEKAGNLPPSSRKALSKIEHVRAELANVYRQAKTGQIDIGDASKLTYILYTLAKLIEVDDLERRIIALEKETTKR